MLDVDFFKHINDRCGHAASGATSLRALLSQADAALYAAKANGRNQSQAWYPGISVPS